MLAYLVPLTLMFLGATVFLFRLRFIREEPSATPAPPTGASLPVSIVVPARNEAHNLPALLQSLAELSPPPAEVIVVDDHSTDGTGELARRHGVRVVVPEPRPSDWLGKSWACRCGARVAGQPYVLFTDADTVHAPDSLWQSYHALRASGASLLSVVPTHILRAGWERLQGVYQLLLLIATRAGSTQRAGRGGRRFAIGQYLLFERTAYDAIGGHYGIRGRLSEDLALAAAMGEAGFGVQVLARKGLLNVRMYPEGFAAFRAGWRRSMRDGIGTAGLVGVLEIVCVMSWLLGLPVWALEALVSGHGALFVAWSLAYVATALVVAWHQEGVGDFPHWTALLYPVFALVFVGVTVACFVDSLRGAPVRWRGRVIELAR